ncbi:TcaA NTF2-like domain-containing protein [Alkalicoccus urumqiensis]|uniref:Zinc ribbon domain-containing protein n=1 Tax=Alkalicoccus urumqiensis TaxID=1548213 RepID=A0A2P6MHU8_ALKUR|nr:hypothetical protein [Alkalicoccus urumqiensis]PRO65869.1 hypothetical protein C6I21_08210 [Alkalicoccus urumqiensis]
MAFCTKCGSELQNGSCPTCHSAPPARSAKKSKKSYALIVPLVLLGGTHLFLNYWTAPDRVIEGFEQAVLAEDADALSDYVGTASGPLTTEYLQQFSDYINDSPYISRDFSLFIEEQHLLAASDNFVSASNQYEAPMNLHFLKLTTNDSILGLYDTYTFEIAEQPLLISTNYEDVSFTVNGEVVTASDQGGDTYWLGDYPPGTYDITASLELDHDNVQRSDTLELFDGNDVFSLPFHLDYVYVETHVEEADLYYNGEPAMEVGLGETEFGPVLLEGDEEMQIRADSPFGALASEVFFADESTHHAIELSLAGEDADAVMASLEEAVAEEYNSGYDDILESVTFYPESLSILQDGSWYAGIEADEEWVSVYEDYNSEVVTDTKVGEVVYLFEYTGDAWEHYYTETSYEDRDIYSEEVVQNVDSADTAAAELQAQIDEEAAALQAEIEAEEATLQAEIEAEEAAYEQQQAEAAEEQLWMDLDYLMSDFTSESVYAVNSGDTSYLESYIHPDGSDYQAEAFDYILSLYDRNITQSIDWINVVDYDMSGDTITVYTEEEYTIDYDLEEVKVKTFDSVYELKEHDGILKIVRLVETTETASEDVEYY